LPHHRHGEKGMPMDALTELEQQIGRLQSELALLKSKTDLEAVQKRLDGFMDEVRLLHRGLIVTLKEMIVELNKEGTKRYEGAVKAVSDNSNERANELKLILQSVLAKLDKFSMMV
jgi:hypothetical protein